MPVHLLTLALSGQLHPSLEQTCMDVVEFPAVILLAFVLALGFLLVILSCALWGNWLPILVGEYIGSSQALTPALTFILAPLPNSICSRCARADDLSPEFNSAYVDFGRFLTGMLVVGFYLAIELTSDDRSISSHLARARCPDSTCCLLDVDCWRWLGVWDHTGVFRMVWREH
jgi:hypothetical protein